MNIFYDLTLAEETFGKHFEKVEELIDFLEKYVEEHGSEDERFSAFIAYHQKIWRKEAVKDDGARMYNEQWNDVTDDYIEQVKTALLRTDKLNNFSCGYIADVVENELGEPVTDKYKVIYIHGGRNGKGNWISYSEDIAKLFVSLVNPATGGFDSAWLLKTDVDVADDVFYMWIGVK